MQHAAQAPADRVAFNRAYPGRADQARHVRADLRELLDGCPVIDEAILCVSELAANAVLHSQSGYLDATFIVRAEIHRDSYVWIEVEDQGGPWAEAAPDPSRGRGLDIIRALAADWGIDGDHRSRVIWARISWPKEP